jgi:hypothetical protein
LTIGLFASGAAGLACWSLSSNVDVSGGGYPADAAPATLDGNEPDLDASTASFCSTLVPAPGFCEDFDERPFPGGFDPPNVRAGAATPERENARSAPFSLVTSVGASSDSAYGRLEKALPEGHRFEVAFDFRVGARSPAQNASLATITLGTSNADAYWLTFGVNDAGALFGFEYRDRKPSPDTSPIDIRSTVDWSAWHRIAIVVELTKPQFATLSIDGTDAANAAISPPWTDTRAKPSLSIGVKVDAPTGRWAFSYDNVAFSSL